MQESRDFFFCNSTGILLLQFIAVNPGIFPVCIHAIQTICDDDNTRETEFLVVDATFELLGIYEGLDNPQKTLRKLLGFWRVMQ